MNIRDHKVAIIGGGPVGLAAAAHLTKRKIPFVLFESGNQIGNNLLNWGHVQVFSPWKYNIDKVARELLLETGWKQPNDDLLPTGKEIVTDYLIPLSLHPKLKPNIELSTKVISVSKKGLDKMKSAGRQKVPFVVITESDSKSKMWEVSAVIDASGTWQNPNPIGMSGLYAKGEIENADRISYHIPDITGSESDRFAGKKVMVVGSGHSAINSLLALASLRNEHSRTEIFWAIRNQTLSKLYGGKEDDALPARGNLGIQLENLVNAGILHILAPFQILSIENNGSLTVSGLRNDSYETIEGIDEIIANTGARPDLSMLREVRVQTDPALESVVELAELIDPNVHSCGTVRPHGELELRQPEPNLYVVGVKSYGRAPTFLMATGYEQIRSISAWLDGDIESARKVELDLPETGVCSIGESTGESCCGSAPSPKTEEVEAAGCCGGAPTENEAACCKLDEEKKAEGLPGCGCGSENKQVEKVTAGCC